MLPTGLARLAVAAVLCLAAVGVAGSAVPDTLFEVRSPRLASGSSLDLAALSGQVTLVVNVASECGYTEDGYEAMRALSEKYRPHGLTVIAAPCNQFGEQEPGTDRDVLRFAESAAGKDTLVVLSKVEVVGPNADPLFEFLNSQAPGDVAWNFERFVVGRDGMVAARFLSADPWADTERVIRRELVREAHEDL